MMSPFTDTDRAIEPRGATVMDLLVGMVGVSCAFALPSGLSWFSLQDVTDLRSLELVTDLLLWSCCVAAVASSFAIVGRHFKYRRGARPAECLVIAIATVYLSLALTELHADYSSLSILVTKMEAGMQTELGPLVRVASALLLFAVVAGYVGVLLWQGQLTPYLKTLLGTALVLFWYWGPAAVWAAELYSLASGSGRNSLSAGVLLPQLPMLFLPLVLLLWAIWCWWSAGRWWLAEYAGVVLFGMVAVLLYFHPSVQHYRETPTFFFELIVFVVSCTATATLFGWGLAYVNRALLARPRARATPSLDAANQMPYNHEDNQE